MRFAAAFGALCATFTLAAAATDAKKVINNPLGASYSAELPDSNKTTLRGAIVATTTEGETKDEHIVNFLFSLSGIPTEGGPFTYHIHDKPVPADGNCTGTTGHLDPYGRGDSPACESGKPETCEVGDLSGKHGKINTNVTAISSNFADAYVALIPGSAAFFGNRSFVIHAADKTRLACANFTVISAGAGVNSTNSTGSASASSSSSGSSSSASSTGASSSPSPTSADKNAAGRNGVASGVVALVMAVCAAALL